MKIPFVRFDSANGLIRSQVIETFNEFFDGGQYILGNYLKKFERDFATYNESKFFVGVSNGLDALYLSLKSLGIGSGDEVIVPVNSFIATALAVEATGARTIFVEPDEKTSNIDPNKIEERISDRTRAIIPVHLYGRPCQMDQIMQLANQNELLVIEDNAQAQGATFQGKKTGTFGILGATSFYPGKNLGALGDAGGISVSDPDLYEKLLALRNYGSKKKYEHEIKGFNMRMDEIQAAILSIKLKYLEDWNQQRRMIAKEYIKELSPLKEITLPYEEKEGISVYHLFVIHLSQRNRLKEYLEEAGIGTGIHYPTPIHLQGAFKEYGYRIGDFPISEKLAGTALSLPIYPGLKLEEIKYICNSIKIFFSA